MNPCVHSATQLLTHVLLGRADTMGLLPDLDDLYDPSSRKHLQANTFPTQEAIADALQALALVFQRYGVNVLYPDSVPNCNQVFVRDLGFVIDDIWVQSNIIPHRARELEGLTSLKNLIPEEKQLTFPDRVHLEGGDVLYHNDCILVGICTRSDYASLLTARTNKAAVAVLSSAFPKKSVRSFELIKSNTIPEKNALHLDCCLQLLGDGLAITCPEGFAIAKEYAWLVHHIGASNIFEVTALEMSQMMCNLISISAGVVVSDPRFDRLNNWLRKRGITVEEVDFSEVAKQGGSFRCVTMPLKRLP